MASFTGRFSPPDEGVKEMQSTKTDSAMGKSNLMVD